MKRNYTLFIPLFLLLVVAMVSCSNNSRKSDGDNEENATKGIVNVPRFNADSAYLYIQAQADFGPRVPNTTAHKACGNFLANKLEELGAKVYNQKADLVAYDNTILKARNIIGSYNPENKGAFSFVPIGTADRMPTRTLTKRATGLRFSE